MRTLMIGFAAAQFLTPLGLRAQSDPSSVPVSKAPGDSVSAPLFASSETLTLSLALPLRDLLRMRDRDAREWLDATLTYADAAGGEKAINMRVRTRGRFRLGECQFPPIQLDFRRPEVLGTLFEGQNRLKLVTHCQDRRDEYEQFVLQEYLIYRMYNLFTEKSFRVRLARIRYSDSQSDRAPVERYGFLIEDEGAMARRNGWEILDQFPIVPPDDQDQATLHLVNVFQFMVGNSDWSAIKAPPGEQQCCHNVVIIGSTTPPVFGVPYDFDWTGLINAPYAKPAPNLGIRSVRQRVYRGFCGPEGELERAVERFREQRDAIYALIDQQEGLTDRKKMDTRRYLEEFYKILDDPRQVERQIARQCRKM